MHRFTTRIGALVLVIHKAVGSSYDGVFVSLVSARNFRVLESSLYLVGLLGVPLKLGGLGLEIRLMWTGGT